MKDIYLHELEELALLDTSLMDRRTWKEYIKTIDQLQRKINETKK